MSSGPDADQRVVVDAVVLALELHDLARGRCRRGRCASRASSPRCRRPSSGPCRPSRSARTTSSIGADLVLAGQAEADALAHPLVDVVVDARRRRGRGSPGRSPSAGRRTRCRRRPRPGRPCRDRRRSCRRPRPGSSSRCRRAGAPGRADTAPAGDRGGGAGSWRGGGLGGHEVLGCGFEGRPGPWDGRCAIRDAREPMLTHRGCGVNANSFRYGRVRCEWRLRTPRWMGRRAAPGPDQCQAAMSMATITSDTT